MRKPYQSQVCSIKELLYPDLHKPTKNVMGKNFKHIRIQQEKNRLKKEELKEYKERK